MKTSHRDEILEKMNSSKYIDLSFELAKKLTNESERGAILIGTSKVEMHLEALIKNILPSKQKSYTDKLLNYPGALSSLSGKIELCFAFRIIDKRLYNSLTSLRKIRNKAAHSDDFFTLEDAKENLDIIYDFEEGFKTVTHDISKYNLREWKRLSAKQMFIESELDQSIDFDKIWNEQTQNLENEEIFQEQLRVWKLFYGLTILCLKIEAIKEELIENRNFNS